MKKFRVTLCLYQKQFCVYEIDAESKEQAHSMALSFARIDYRGSCAWVFQNVEVSA